MTASEQFLKLIDASFPIEPLPTRFFWAEGENSPHGDIPEELMNRIAHRRWTDVTIQDWAMIGAPPSITRGYLEPATFLYYLPSLIVGVFRETEYMDFAVEAIIPSGRDRRPRGKWWSEFSKSVSLNQRVTLSAFLANVRLMFWESIGPATQQQVYDAEAIWSSDNREFHL
jgi:hypothetical protein